MRESSDVWEAGARVQRFAVRDDGGKLPEWRMWMFPSLYLHGVFIPYSYSIHTVLRVSPYLEHT